jgi:tRNA threonylcarbamoyladenosine biosynthesis protein TsaB
MSRILLIETATEVCSAAIAVDGVIVAIAEELQAPSHATLLTLQIDDCVRRAGIDLAALDAIAVSRGPGSYTALRVGASVAKGLCYALDKPLIAVDTLQALAWASQNAPVAYSQVPESRIFIPMLDARRQEVWLAVYDALLNAIAPEQPLIIENNSFENLICQLLPDAANAVFVISGNGSEKIKNVPLPEKTVFSEVKKCSASHLAALSEQIFQRSDFQDVAYFEPFYMKAPNITTPSKAPF